MTERSLAQIKLAAAEMQEILDNIPSAQHGPWQYYQQLDREISQLEKTIKRLQSFIAFLAKLNPAEYLNWMHAAFAKFSGRSATKESLTHAEEPYETPIAVAVATPTKGKKSKKTKTRPTTV